MFLLDIKQWGERKNGTRDIRGKGGGGCRMAGCEKGRKEGRKRRGRDVIGYSSNGQRSMEGGGRGARVV